MTFIKQQDLNEYTVHVLAQKLHLPIIWHRLFLEDNIEIFYKNCHYQFCDITERVRNIYPANYTTIHLNLQFTLENCILNSILYRQTSSQKHWLSSPQRACLYDPNKPGRHERWDHFYVATEISLMIQKNITIFLRTDYTILGNQRMLT